MFDAFIKKLILGPLFGQTIIDVFLINSAGPNHSDKMENRFVVSGQATFAEKIEEVIGIIRNSSMKKHVVNFTGGEIFNEGIGTNYFLVYAHLYSQLLHVCMELDVELEVNWVTDMLFKENEEMVSWLLEKCPTSKLCGRYSFIGSGLNLNKRLVLQNNIRNYKDHIRALAIVLDKPNINGLIEGKDRFFMESIYPEYQTYYDWHDPEQTRKKALPAAQEIVEAVMTIESKYPNMKRTHFTPKHILQLLLD
jgi:hypothetical protein